MSAAVLASVPVASMSIDVLFDATVAAFFCIFAANLGSFLNVVSHRVPRGTSVVRGGSRCPACGSPVRWYDNVPVVGWLVLGGRCRDCDAPIARRYPLVEAAACAIGGIAAVELLSGGRTWPEARFGTGRTGVDILLVEGDWRLALVCAVHAALLFVLLLWTLFESDRTRVPAALLFAVTAGLAVLAVGAGGPTVLAGWPAAGQAAAGAATGALLGIATASPWLRQAFVLVGVVLGWKAFVSVAVVMVAAAAGRRIGGWLRGRRAGFEPRCGDLLAAVAVQLLAWRWLAAVWPPDA